MEQVARLREFMHQTLSDRDLPTLRVFPEYGFTDHERTEQLGIPLLLVRRMRERLGLEPNSQGHAVLRDRDTARRANQMHPAQADLGGRDRHAGPVILRMVDDWVLTET